MKSEIQIIGFICLVFTNVHIVSSFKTPKCSLHDTKCLKNAANLMMAELMGGIPSLGVESSDPLHVKLVNSQLSSLKYTFTDSVIDGYKSCRIEDIRFDMEKNVMHIVAICQFNMTGKYDMQGQLLILPITGNGEFSIHTKDVRVVLDTDFELTQNEDGSSQLHLKKFKLQDPEALEPVTFDFTNLFNGNKQLGDAAIKFANESYKDITRELSSPIYVAALKQVMKNVNKYLKSISI